jgi:hypothetical protein
MRHYEILRREEVDPMEWLVVDLSICLAANELQIRRPEVNFIRGTIPQCADIEWPCAIWGLASGGKIYVHRGLDSRNLVGTCFHEARHVWQVGRGMCDRSLNERDAAVFAHEILCRLGDPPSWQIAETLMKGIR